MPIPLSTAQQLCDAYKDDPTAEFISFDDIKKIAAVANSPGEAELFARWRAGKPDIDPLWQSLITRLHVWPDQVPDID
jgi:hypothetical protein